MNPPPLFEVVVIRLPFAALDMLVAFAVVWLICRLWSPRSARVRAVLWLLVPVKGLIVLGCGSVWTMKVGAVPTSAIVDVNAMGPARVGTPLVWVFWLSGVVLFFGVFLYERWRSMTLVRDAAPVDTECSELVKREARRLGLAPPSVRRTSALVSPALIGAWRPVILLPQWLYDREELEWAIRHELMHARLRDPWAALVHDVASVLFFFHPVAWLARRRWREAAELACDRALVKNGDESLDYASRLHALAARVRAQPSRRLTPGLFAARSQVGRRIEALLQPPRGTARLTRMTRTLLAVLFLSALAVGTGALEAAGPDPIVDSEVDPLATSNPGSSVPGSTPSTGPSPRVGAAPSGTSRHTATNATPSMTSPNRRASSGGTVFTTQDIQILIGSPPEDVPEGGVFFEKYYFVTE